jgi:uncharacterized SAM-binding protein YcdF (DUF218 family)
MHLLLASKSEQTRSRRGVSHCGLGIYIIKCLYTKGKFKYFTMQKYDLKNNPLKEIKILQNIIILLTNFKLNTSQNIIFQKSSYKNKPIIIIT